MEALAKLAHTHPIPSFILIGALIFIAAFFTLLTIEQLIIKGLIKSHRLRLQQKEIKRPNIPWPGLDAEPPTTLEKWFGWARLYRYALLTKLQKRRLFIGVSALVLLCAIAGPWPFVTSIIIIFAAIFYINRRARLNQKKAATQLPDALQSLADTLRSGLSLPQGIAFIASELDAPSQQIFDALVRAEALNIDFSEALHRVSRHLSSTDWTTVAEIMSAQQKIGGPLSALLEETIKTLRSKLNTEAEIKSLTAAGRMSGFLIGGLVPLILVVFFLFSPSYLSILFTTALGRIFFMLAMILEIVGFIWIKKVTTITY